MKRNDGFTLVEMLVSIIVGTLATAAVATLLLLGIRMNAKISEIATQDNQAMICFTVMESMVKEHKIKNEAAGTFTTITAIDESGAETALLTYVDKKIKTSAGAVLLEDVYACEFEMSADKKTIKIKLQLDEDEEAFEKTIRLVTGQPIKLAP